MTGKITEIDSVGVLTIQFGDEMLVPNDLSIIDKVSLYVNLILGEEGN